MARFQRGDVITCICHQRPQIPSALRGPIAEVLEHPDRPAAYRLENGLTLGDASAVLFVASRGLRHTVPFPVPPESQLAMTKEE